jgi:phytoene dehydrogenase-like protein
VANASRDIVIIGAGHNGLVTAGYLARAGLRPLVLERREVVGGAAITEEFHPGFRCSTLAHAAGPLLPAVVRELQLARHGLEFIQPDVQVFAPGPDGRGLVLYNDQTRSSEAIARWSAQDARRYSELNESLRRIGHVLIPLLSTTPPSIDQPSTKDLWNLMVTGKRFRGLDRRDAYRLLRWIPMPVADLAAEWYETDLMQAISAGRGIFGTFAGPWSAGTSAALRRRGWKSGRAPALPQFWCATRLRLASC